ncbi:iron uptake transporter permease EfeU [Aestuariivirga sp.]|uniref:iron uptake transporter permease EfeU n=1 Tax=Aestuariivirga sp. TaxID=2650926 RepID=UPI003BACA722
MLATFIIGLREGLEAALIVGILAAFLRRNGMSLGPMWLGVTLAIVLSIAVGVGLALLEQTLPQAGQEALETVIGVVAVFFVTCMITWMSVHARTLKVELEAGAAAAMSRPGAYALTAMAFLAVLREGFETSVFLLATFSASQSAGLAAAGAIMGLLLSLVIGWGIYVGGVKINLSRFFRITSGFLILVAAGLVISCLRTAHEAGWLVAGQQRSFELSWLVAPGTVRSALITGVLGIPADPRLIEVIGWLCYLVPMMLFVYWPKALRPAPRGTVRLKFAIAAVLAVLGAGLALLYPVPQPVFTNPIPIIGLTEDASPLGSLGFEAMANGAAQLHVIRKDGADQMIALAAAQGKPGLHDGIDVTTWGLRDTSTPAKAPDSISLEQLTHLVGGRVPPGLNPALHPGPYAARWSVVTTTDVWAAGGTLVDAASRGKAVLTVSGSGLPAPRVLTVGTPPDRWTPDAWRVDPAHTTAILAALRGQNAAETERRFWARQLPVVCVLTALLLAGIALRDLRRLHQATVHPAQSPHNADKLIAKGATHASS